ncbi:DUF2505 domain-containing protein [Cellulomonas persica]|uniref:DUF2505 domain-containing protein n=1 Tax=Cellulomonas persica TaxID=76861 RepID=A0A510UVF9_9CELL|nr:DUF2505 domain-containing protein [Cellulomonas persica]GEK17120.1 hypothetical protein CPE01_08530 [Cellulomonas persica]
MHLSEMLVLPTDPRTAARLLADPGYVREKVEAAGATCEQVDVTHDDAHADPAPAGDATPGAGDDVGAFTVTTRRALPTDQIPAQVRAFVGNRIEVRQVEAWEAPDDEGARVGTVVVEVVGVPVRLAGRVTLVAHGAARTAVRYDGEVHAAIPLFGGAVEEATAAAIRGALAAEEQVARHRFA